jgi:glycosyltransferase involved in cell wall biosynthesis
MKVLLCHPQTQHSHKLAIVLYKNGFLSKFINPFVLSSQNKLWFIPKKILNFIRNRVINIPNQYLEKNLILEFQRIFIKNVLNKNDIHNYFEFRERYQNSISTGLILNSDIIIGFDSSSWLLGNKVKNLNKVFILERTTVHHNSTKELYAFGREKYPEWRKEFIFPMPDEYIELEDKELKIADFISVGSNFVKNSLIENGVSESKIIVNQYGVNTNFFLAEKKNEENPIKFLFFGTICARKGIPVLLNSWRKLSPSNAILILAGFGDIPQGVILPASVNFIGEVLPHERNNLFKNAHVFVFPSLVEGFAQVLVEASVCGLPIITTFNSGGAEIVEEGINGFIVNAFDEDELADRISYFISNPNKINEMGFSRINEIRKKFSMEDYEKRWLSLINKIKNFL